jgi:hypothetical protein
VVISKLGLSGASSECAKYSYQNTITYWVRSESGGVFLGVELPFDSSALAEDGTITLGYRPSLKVKPNERIESEPIYIGVYKRCSRDQEEPGHPLPSKSEAMVAMTSAIMGSPRHGLLSVACGWWSEMEDGAYNAAQVEGDMRSIDFLMECGIDRVSDSHTLGWRDGKDECIERRRPLRARTVGQPIP